MPDSTDIQVQLRDALYKVRYQPAEDTFRVVPSLAEGETYSYLWAHDVATQRGCPCN